MDILHLIERLENMVKEGRRLPMTASVLLDEDRINNVIDQMREAIPAAIKRAERIEAEREKILAQATEEAERIRALARQEAEEMVSRHAVTAKANSEAEQTMTEAYYAADRVRHGADEYSLSVLAQLEQDMVRALRVVQNGLHRLERDKAALLGDEPPEPSEPAPEAETKTVSTKSEKA